MKHLLVKLSLRTDTSVFKKREILTTLSKQVFLLKIADFPQYIRVDNTERWLSKW